MGAKPVQISIDEELLRRVDADPQTVAEGRSSFVRSALRMYLRAKERSRVDESIRAAYDGQADEMLEEIEDLLGAQTWPEK